MILSHFELDSQTYFKYSRWNHALFQNSFIYQVTHSLYFLSIGLLLHIIFYNTRKNTLVKEIEKLCIEKTFVNNICQYKHQRFRHKNRKGVESFEDRQRNTQMYWTVTLWKVAVCVCKAVDGAARKLPPLVK